MKILSLKPALKKAVGDAQGRTSGLTHENALIAYLNGYDTQEIREQFDVHASAVGYCVRDITRRLNYQRVAELFSFCVEKGLVIELGFSDVRAIKFWGRDQRRIMGGIANAQTSFEIADDVHFLSVREVKNIASASKDSLGAKSPEHAALVFKSYLIHEGNSGLTGTEVFMEGMS